MTELFYTTFSVSGVSAWVFTPLLVAFGVSFFTSMCGVSGAFALLPFQISVLNYTTPSVSGTNHLFNVLAIPSGVWRYIKEKRMIWPLTWTVVLGTLPGVLIGVWVRLVYLPDSRDFKFFAGLVLLYLGVNLFVDIFHNKRTAEIKINKSSLVITETHFSLRKVVFKFGGQTFRFSVPKVFLLGFFVGIIGGIYGIGGGAIIVPFFVTFFRLPVYAVAGASLMGTLVTSIVGVVTYQTISAYYPGLPVAPDWHLGFLFGVGGFFGMYLGARCQKYVPGYAIKFILGLCVLSAASQYIYTFIAL